MLNQIGAIDRNARTTTDPARRDQLVAERDQLIVAAVADGITVDQILRVVYSLTADDVARIAHRNAKPCQIEGHSAFGHHHTLPATRWSPVRELACLHGTACTKGTRYIRTELKEL